LPDQIREASNVFGYDLITAWTTHIWFQNNCAQRSRASQ
jgi:hypothetical protein